jgi:SAM-dependent methyltransferase
MTRLVLEETATVEHFDETAYLLANPDVAAAVERGDFRSGREHFDLFGYREHRRVRHDGGLIAEAKARKLARLAPLLRLDLPHTRSDAFYDFLTSELRERFGIVDSDAVSSNEYDGQVLAMIERHPDSWILDCGAGRRPVYFDNVVNFEIAPFDTTDVRGVAEVLPFVDGVFDGVISIAVLEHVKDPFGSARELVRVLRPGGELMCCVPFLQPLHGYPYHYYNMTPQGLRNLFEPSLVIEDVTVYDSVRPIWSLQWILNSWAGGLVGAAREEFLGMRVADLLVAPPEQLDRSFVRELSAEKNLELASACVLFAHKPT